MPCSSFAQCPAMFAYQVWLCTRSQPATPSAMARSVPSVCSAAFAALSSAGVRYARAVGRSWPKQCTCTSSRWRNCAVRYSTWTPAPPYTSGGNSRVSKPTRTGGSLAGHSSGHSRCAAAQQGSTGPIRATVRSVAGTRAPRVLGIVLAGGEGKRLAPLTADRAKPAVPFGGSYRLVDFVLSNLVNGGYPQNCVPAQYQSHHPGRAITTTWRGAPP